MERRWNEDGLDGMKTPCTPAPGSEDAGKRELARTQLSGEAKSLYWRDTTKKRVTQKTNLWQDGKFEVRRQKLMGLQKIVIRLENKPNSISALRKLPFLKPYFVHYYNNTQV